MSHYIEENRIKLNLDEERAAAVEKIEKEDKEIIIPEDIRRSALIPLYRMLELGR